MVKNKIKTLGDYISGGEHEFLAFIKDSASLAFSNRSNYNTHGNDLGTTHFGVLVCNRELENKRSEENDRAKFFYKDKPIYNKDSDISFRDFSYNAKVISEVPLSLSTSFYSGRHLDKGSKEFRKAKELLQKYGIY